MMMTMTKDEYREPAIECWGPPLLRLFATIAGLAILGPALLALIGPLFA
jgi:hypothetical protein